MQHEAIETIRICLQQRTIFMTSIYNITKQLQVKASQDEIDFGDLLDTRQDYMDRIDRCDTLIKTQLDEMQADEKGLVQSLLDGSNTQNIPERFVEMKSLIEEYNRLLEATRVLDKEATQLVKEKHADLKERINAIRLKRASIEE